MFFVSFLIESQIVSDDNADVKDDDDSDNSTTTKFDDDDDADAENCADHNMRGESSNSIHETVRRTAPLRSNSRGSLDLRVTHLTIVVDVFRWQLEMLHSMDFSASVLVVIALILALL